MGYIKNIAKYSLAITILISLSFCGESPTTAEQEEEQGQPWTVIIESGNFAVNTASIVMYDDSRSLSATNYFVYENSLPNANFEYFDINIYVPTTENIDIHINNIEAFARFTDTDITDNIYQSGSYVGSVELFDDGQEYSQFQLTSRYTGTKALTKSNFANYHMTFQVHFRDPSTDEVLGEIQSFYNEVYKRSQ